MLELFHGSPVCVKKPVLEKCKPHNDYGRGFYCTQHAELAKEWAYQKGRDGFCNRYFLYVEGLNIVDLNAEDFTLLHWLAVLSENRIVNASTPTMRRGQAWLHEYFGVDLSCADVVKGYRADDSYFGFARAFLRNEITLGQLSETMRLGSLGEQYMMKSSAAFSALEYVGADVAESAIYWPARNRRDMAARSKYENIVSESPSEEDGWYIADLMRMKGSELNAVLR